MVLPPFVRAQREIQKLGAIALYNIQKYYSINFRGCETNILLYSSATAVKAVGKDYHWNG